MAHRGPPPPGVLQHQLALPATRPRPPAPGGPGPVQLVTPLRRASAATAVAEAEADGEATGTADTGAAEPTSAVAVEEHAEPEAYTWHEDRPVVRRVRSTVALVVVLTFVGAAVAILVGIALALASLAIHQTVG
jgi:hypothetical protein